MACYRVVRLWQLIMSLVTLQGITKLNANSVFHVSTPSLVAVNQEFEIIFSTDFTSYPDILCSWDFQDDTVYMTGAAELQQSITHNYTSPAAYVIVTVCETFGTLDGYYSEVLAYSEIHYEICAFRSVNLTYDYDIYVLGESNVLVFYHYDFEDPLFYYMELDGLPVFEESFSYGPLQNNELYAVQMDTLPFPMELQYIIGLGVHNVSVTVYSEANATAVYCESEIKFVEVVSGLVFYISASFVQTSAPFIGSLAADTGWPALIEWKAQNMEDRDVDFFFDSYRQARGPDEVDEVWLYIFRPGNYTVTATMYHEINEESEWATVIVENPIREFDVVDNSPLHFPYESELELRINFTDSPLPSDNVSYPGLRFPTDVYCDIDYGDGVTDLFLLVQYDPQFGNFSLHHTYSQGGLYLVQIFFYNYVSSAHQNVPVAILEDIGDMWLTSFSGDSGNMSTIVPLDFPVLFEVVTQGTAESYQWIIDGDVINTTDPQLQYKFPTQGEFAAEAHAINVFSSGSNSIIVTVVEGITGIYLINNGPVTLGNAMPFVLFSHQLGLNSVFSIDFGDGSSTILPGLSVQGNDIMSYVPSDLDLPFDPRELFSVVVSHTYASTGVYTAIASASNAVSSRQVSSDAFVQVSPCQIDALHILDGDSSYASAKRYHRDRRFQFAAEVLTNCPQAGGLSYQWLLHKLDDIFTIPTPENFYHLPPAVRTDLNVLYVPSFTLEYGSYVFRLLVTVFKKDGSAGVNKADQTYATVVQTPLFARVVGGSSVAVGWSQSITVDGSPSFDPDYPNNQGNLTLSWFCRRSNETFPPDEDLLLLWNQSPGQGGCFGNGYLLQSSNATSVGIPAQTLEGNQTYTFRLLLSKSGRDHASAQQSVTILPGDPPTILIQCLVNCGPSLNPSERLVLSAKCQNCTLHTRPRYQWSLLPAHQDNSRQGLLWGKDTTTSGTNSYLAIRANTFQGAEQYSLRLDVDSWSGASTFAEYVFETNSPPTPGNCSISPLEGVVLENKFTIMCEGFEDPDEPVSYEIRAVTDAEKKSGFASLDAVTTIGTMIYFGVDPNIPPSNLPVGLASRDYQVDIYIKVTDAYGAFVGTSLYAKVREPVTDPSQPYASVTDTILEMTAGEGSALAGLLDTGDDQGATQLVVSLTSLLNAEADSDHRQAETSTLEEKEEERDVMVQKKSKRVKARNAILSNIHQIEVRDMETLQQTSAAIDQVTREKEEISASAQLSAAESFQGMSSFLKEQSDGGAGEEAVDGTASFIVSGLSNIMEAAFSTLASATNGSNSGDSLYDRADATVVAENNRNITRASLQALGNLQTAVLQNKVPGEDQTVIQTEAVSLVLQRQERWEVASSVRDSKAGRSFFQLPEGALEGSGELDGFDDIIDSHMHHYNHNPFAWVSMGTNDITSHVTSLELEMSSQDGHKKLTLSNLSDDIDIFIKNKDSHLAELQPRYTNNSAEVCYGFNITSEMAYVVVEIVVSNCSISGDHLPELWVSLTHGAVSLNTSFPEAAAAPVVSWNDTSNSTGNPYLWIVPFIDIGVTGTFDLTLEGWEGVLNQSCSAVYSYGAQCVYWNPENETWDNAGCKVGPLTSQSVTHCQCNHLSHFAAGFVVLPNTVDFVKDAALFAKILENPVAAVAVGALFGLYLLVALWARRRDRREEEQAQVIFLGDNNPEATYKYHVTVFTGMRRGAGTSSVATVTLFGTAGSSGPRVLATEGKRRILQRGGIDSFILTTHGSLGDLTAVRVWHDNSGKRPEWHINRILVHDLQTKHLWYFLCHGWLAVDLGECTVDRTFPVALPEDLHQFEHLFITRLLRDMKDHHLWVSIFSRPPNSGFTRLQRVTCCYTLLMMAMLASIMFFGITPEDALVDGSTAPEMTQEIGVGTIRVTWFDILVGIESGLIVLPGNLLILAIFRNARPRSQAKDVAKRGKAAQSLSSEAFVTVTDDIPSEKADHTGDGDGTSARAVSTRTSPSTDDSFRTVDETRETASDTDNCVHGQDSKARDSENSANTSTDCTVPEHSAGKHTPVCCCLRSCPKNKTKPYRKDSNTSSTHGTLVSDQTAQPLEENHTEGITQSVVDHDLDNEPVVTPPNVKTDQNGPPFFMRHEDYLHHHIYEIYEEIHNAPKGYFRSEEDRKKALRKLDETLKTRGWGHFIPQYVEDHSTEDAAGKQCCPARGCLPWWFVYIGWFCVVATNLVCAYLVVLYGLSYGLQKSLDWLVSMVVTLFQDIFVLQPGKVILVAAFFAIIWKKHEDDDVGLDLFADIPSELVKDASFGRGHGRRGSVVGRYYQPPPPQSVNRARERRQAQVKMCKMVKELLGQILLGVLALEVSHLQRDPNSYMLHQSMADTFTGGFDDVSSINDVYSFLQDSFIPELYGETRGFMADGRTYRVGRARLRQVRIAPDSCKVPRRMDEIIKNCTGTLRLPKQMDKQPYAMSWSAPISNGAATGDQPEDNPWSFSSRWMSEGSYLMGTEGLYSRGGYIRVLGSTARSSRRYLQELEDLDWLDEHTRALYIEWTVYSPDAGLLCVCTVLFEASAMGNVVASSQFHAFRVFTTTTVMDKVNLALQSMYIIVIFVLIRLEVKKLRRKKMEYFHFWNVLNMLTILLSVTAAVIYGLWATSIAIAVKTYKEDSSQFTSFFFAVVMDQTFMCVTGLLVFVTTLRCAKILRFNSSILTVHHTFSRISSQFFVFTLTLFIFLFAFSFLFCMAFGAEVLDFKDMGFSFQSVFLFLAGGYEGFMDVSEQFPRLGPVYFFLMTFVLFFLLFNFFLLLILYSFQDARKVIPDEDYKDVIAAIVEWAFSVLSIKRIHKDRQNQTLPTKKRSKRSFTKVHVV